MNISCGHHRSSIVITAGNHPYGNSIPRARDDVLGCPGRARRLRGRDHASGELVRHTPAAVRAGPSAAAWAAVTGGGGQARVPVQREDGPDRA